MTLWSSFIHYNSAVTRRDWEKDYLGGGVVYSFISSPLGVCVTRGEMLSRPSSC